MGFLKIIHFRWLDTVLKKLENSRFRSVFLDNYYRLKNKKYLIDVKQNNLIRNGVHFEFFHKLSYATAVATLYSIW